MLILLRSTTNEQQFFAEKHNLLKNISQFSDSMSDYLSPFQLRLNLLKLIKEIMQHRDNHFL